MAPAGDEQYPAEVFAARIRAVIGNGCETDPFGARVRGIVDNITEATNTDGVSVLASSCAAAIERLCVAYNIEKALRRPVSCRLASHISFSELYDKTESREHGLTRMLLWAVYHAEGYSSASRRPVWPSSVSLDDVAAVLARSSSPEAAEVLATVRRGVWTMVPPGEMHSPAANDTVRIPVLSFPRPSEIDATVARGIAISSVFNPQIAALVAWAEKDIAECRRRQFIAVDAGPAHRFVLDAMAQSAGAATDVNGIVRRRGDVELREPSDDDVRNGYVVIFGSAEVQLSIPFDGSYGPDVIDGIRRAVGPEGPRHWAAIQHLATQRGARSGRFVWTTDDHMRVMKYSADHMRDAEVRARVVSAVVALSRLELTVYRRGGQRISRRLLQPIERAEQRGPDGRWTVEGLTLEIHPLVYNGVRDASGELGTNWFPASPDLPSLHHVNYPHAITAGLRLSQRFRWRFGEDGASFIDLSGGNALALFGIASARTHHKCRAWQTFDANVRALQGLPTPGVGKVEWLRGPHTIEGVVRLHAARWQVDRVHDGIAPIEAPRTLGINSGAELRAWRDAQNIGQTDMARALGVSERTLRTAEQSEALPRSVRAAIDAGRLPLVVRGLGSGS